MQMLQIKDHNNMILIASPDKYLDTIHFILINLER